MWQKNWFRKSVLLGSLCAALLALAYSPLGERMLFGRDIPLLGDLKGTVRAPEFPADEEWLNTATPYTIKGLRGKVVLLDFWTFCCINCMHVLPDLHKLEEKYKEELVVLGVHSAKFSREQATAAIRKAVMRYNITHPVLNDRDSRVWDLYAVHAWPTFVLIAPDGKIVGQLSGEGVYDALDRAIATTIKDYDAKGELKRGPLNNRLEKSSVAEHPLSFPGKVLADVKGDRLFVSDSNHHRIVIAKLSDGQVLASIGEGTGMLHDGSYVEAQFRNPQGLALSGDGATLYVADTDNHAIRAVDLKAKSVSTLIGDGTQGKVNSPWDLCLVGDTLYIAMAGAHQIDTLDLGSKKLAVFAGSGHEDLHDGPKAGADLAQTSALSSDGKALYFADSETSSIRQVELKQDGQVTTLVGKGLFHFGDEEGPEDKALLQHPLGVALSGGQLYVADSYNNRIKSIDLATHTVKWFVGHGLPSAEDGVGRKAHFDEPGGLVAAGDKLYVADTNNHAIRIVDIKSGAVTTFKFKGLKAHG